MHAIPKYSAVTDLKGDKWTWPTGINLTNAHSVTHFNCTAEYFAESKYYGNKKTAKQNMWHPAIGCGLLRKCRSIIQNPNPLTREFALWSRMDLRKKKDSFRSFPSLGGKRKKTPLLKPGLYSGMPFQCPGSPRPKCLFLRSPHPWPSWLVLLSLWELLGEALLHETHQMKHVPFLKSNATRVVCLTQLF